MKLAISLSILALTTASPLSGQEARPAPRDLGLPEGTLLHQDVAYVENGHARQKLDLYLPPSSDGVRDADHPLPLVIWIHGGAFRMGDKGGRFRAQSMLRKGYAVASLNYRFSQHAIFPEPVRDCKAAVRWLRANARRFYLDAERFAVWGESAGGYMSSMLGTSGEVAEFETGAHSDVSSRVQCVVDFYGPTDFTLMDEQDKDIPDQMDHDAPDSPESQLLGGPVQEKKELARAANPITYVTRDDPPFLIIHGDRDNLVPHGQSVILEKALKKAGVRVELHTVKGGGHGSGFGEAEQKADESFTAEVLRRK